jgi:hypothetical protein
MLAALVAGKQATVRLRALDAHGNALTTGGASVTAVLETKAPPSDGKENLSQVWAPPCSSLIRASSRGVGDNSKLPTWRCGDRNHAWIPHGSSITTCPNRPPLEGSAVGFPRTLSGRGLVREPCAQAEGTPTRVEQQPTEKQQQIDRTPSGRNRLSLGNLIGRGRRTLEASVGGSPAGTQQQQAILSPAGGHSAPLSPIASPSSSPPKNVSVAPVAVKDRGDGWYEAALHATVVGDLTLRVSLTVGDAPTAPVVKSFRARCARKRASERRVGCCG